MNRLSLVSKNRRGLTLVELLIAGTISALVLSCVCGIYFSIARQCQRQQGQGDALLATSRACSRLSDYISVSMGATVLTRFSTGDALAVNLPANTAYSGVYVPTWSGSAVKYVSGNWLVFYLSDTTGSYNQTGNILWAATMSWTNFPNSVVPDRTWSMYYNTNNGRISPLKSISFSYVDSTNHPKVVITATSSYRIGGINSQLAQSRTVCMRNSN